jgi:hypothetical protein
MLRSRSLEAVVTTAFVLLNTDGDVDTSHRILVGAIEAARQEAAPIAALIEALNMLCLICFFGGRQELWQPLDAAIGRLGSRTPRSLELLRRLYGDPAHAGTPAIDRLDAAVAELHREPDPAEVIRIGTASFYVDRLAGCRPGFRRVAQNGRETGDVATTVKAAQMLAFEAYFEGRWDEADSLLAESLPLGEQHGYRLFVWCAQYGQALLAAARGDDACVRASVPRSPAGRYPEEFWWSPSIAATPRHWPRSDAARSTRHTTKRPRSARPAPCPRCAPTRSG